jgi:hypothetical protein
MAAILHDISNVGIGALRRRMSGMSCHFRNI